MEETRKRDGSGSAMRKNRGKFAKICDKIKILLIAGIFY